MNGTSILSKPPKSLGSKRAQSRASRAGGRPALRTARRLAALLAPLCGVLAGPAAAATTEIGAVREIAAAEAPASITSGGFAVQVGEAAGTYAVPPGFATITAWSHSAGAVAGQLSFKVYRPTGRTREFVAVASDARTIVPNAVHTFPVRIAVRPGDRIGLSSDNVLLAFFTGGAADRIGFFDGDVPTGTTRATDGEPFEQYRLDVAATLDSAPIAVLGPTPPAGETVVIRPGGGSGAAGGPAVTSLRISPRRFRAARGGPTVRSARTRGRGGKITARVDRSTRVRFSFRRLRGGRKAGRGKSARCVAPTRRNRRAARCLREIPLKQRFTRWLRAGSTSFRFTGRLRGRTLRRGAYRVYATPTPRARGVRSVRATFRVR